MDNSEPVKILITGDFCPIGRIEDLVKKSDFKSIINDFSDVIEGNDLNITDLECPLTLSENKRKKTGPHQKADPSTVEILKHLKIRLVTLANNHIMDYGSEGVKEIIDLCGVSGINIVGAGSGKEISAKPFSIVLKNKKISILNFADEEFLSTPDGLYMANPVNPVNNYFDIGSAKRNCDFLIVIVHAGNEFYNLPSPRIKSLYRFYVDSGAAAVISHHTHRFSGYEIYKGKPVFYGLGNFIYDRPREFSTGWNKGYVVRLRISDKTNFEILPLKQCTERPGVFHLNSDETALFNNEIENFNKIISDDSLLESEFLNYCSKAEPMYDAFIEPYFGKVITALQKRKLLPKLMSKRKRLLLLNIIRCESHREVLLNLLKKYE